MALIYSFIVLLLASYINADKETLVLLDNLAIRETHSIFFKSLTGQCSYYKYRHCRRVNFIFDSHLLILIF